MRNRPTPEIVDWLTGTQVRLFYFSAIGEAELRCGAEILPAGKRRASLISRIDRILEEAFEDRILPFDTLAAKSFGYISAMRRSAGRPVSQSDCQIAAIAKSRELMLVTRNTRDFTDVGINLLNPWDHSSS